MAEPGTSHLSIGEVLGLLLEEFPDVTISKIRFLESQGLIEPERTPSGYRKFFDDDVELLRLILREQRERFLPLRVIKRRLASGEIERDPTPAQGASSAGASSADTSSAGPAGDDHARRAAEQPTRAAVAKHPAASRASSVGSMARTSPTGDDTVAAGGRVAPPVLQTTPGDASTRTDGAQRSASGADAHLMPGARLDRDELCAMASISETQLAQLEDYGVVAKPNGITELYDDDAVEVATVAGGFLRAGVDARHLRTWRHSVDREAGLFEQLILPVLRQRNPQARTQVAAQLEELESLGAQLRSAMMRSALRRYLET